MPLRIWIREKGFGWQELPESPFPLTSEQLAKARAIFADELSNSPPLGGANMAPQTAARDILARVAPQLTDFDRLVIGFAVTNNEKNLRIEEE